MENFDYNERPVTKEKNVFLLHLDVPRIILLSAILIGIIIIAFLLGINFNENKGTHNEITHNDLPHDTLTQLDKGIDLGNTVQNPDLSLIDNPDKGTDSTPKAEEPSKLDILLKNEHVEIASPKEDSTVKVVHNDAKKDTMVKNVVKKNHLKGKEIIKKNKVVEVAQMDEPRDEKNKPQRTWSIQIASYTSLSKAQKEAKNLQTMKYDAYVDKANVSGKTYYRVKIGPILKEDKAMSMLQQVQSIDKYKESYIVKE